MSNPKERHYWAQLRTALTAGQWRSHSPAKTPHGASLSWSELFRKFNKHCRGAHDVANVASHTYTLALLISENSVNEDEDNDVLTLDIDAECLISQGKVEKIKAGYEELQSLQSSNLDTIHFALAYYAYALGNPAQCIAHLEKVPDIDQVRTHIPTSLGATLSSTNPLAPPSNTPSITSSFTPSFSSPVDSTVPEVRDGRSLAMAESFRSICLQGMALEHLHPTSPSTALKTYCSVLPHLFPSLKTQFTHKSLLPTLNHQHHKLSSSILDFTVFHQLRELWRWVERIIWRAVVLCANLYDVRKGWKEDEENSTSATPTSTKQQGGEEGDSLWSWLAHYTYYSAYWPSTFRTSHRSTIASIHMRALILLHRSPSLSIPSSPSSAILSPSSLPKSLNKSPPAWLHRARQVIQDYQAILNVSTTFPRAGTRNEKVEEFVDLCVAVWEVYLFGGGAGEVGWVIDILWWATRLTFNSSRILRHMTRLLYLSGDMKLARRTLNLYIQVVEKAYETSGNRSESGWGSGGEDTDTDANWVDTLIFGATMLFKSSCSSSSNLIEMDDLNEAHQIIEKAKTRLNKQDNRLTAKLYLAEGVYWMILGVKGQDPLVRPTHLSLSHTLLLQSVQTGPTPGGYYNLALSCAIPGAAARKSTSSTNSNNADSNNANSNNAKYDLEQAIQYAGLAVEADPGDVKYWHLLGLLLAAQERWEEAREILERGADLGVGEDHADVEGQVGGEVVGGIPTMERTGKEEESDTIETVQPNGDVITLPGPAVSSTNDDSLNTTPTIKTDSIRNIPIINSDPPMTSANPPQPIYVLSHSHSHFSSSATKPFLPPASTLLLTPPPSKYPPSQYDLFESHLQIRMTQGTVMEIVEGAEGAEALWLEVFGWVAERRSAVVAGGEVHRQSIDGITQRSSDHVSSSHHHSTTTTIDGSPRHLHPNSHPSPNAHAHQLHHHQQHQHLGASADDTQIQTQISANGSSDLETNLSLSDIIPITISPASPIVTREVWSSGFENGKDRDREKDQGKGRKSLNNAFRPKRSISVDVERGGNNNRSDGQKSKKNVGQMLKGSVMKSRAGITAATKKLGHGVVRHGGLRRATSTPDFHAVLQQPTFYQASSIHSRRRLSFRSASRECPLESPPPPPPPSTATTIQQQPPSSSTATTVVGHQDIKNERSMKDDRLLSDLWLMSAATFRRLGKIDQAKGAIQEAEVKDENNPAVWVQFGLYYIAIGLYQHAVDTFQKALFICPDDVAATVHLSRLYLDPDLNARLHSSTEQSKPATTSSPTEGTPTTDPSTPSTTLLPNSDVDLAAGMLSFLTKGKGWNVPEAWYYLAKAYGLQGRKEEEKDILKLALELSERRGVRDVGSALGWCYL